MGPRSENLLGRRFGKLLVIEKLESKRGKTGKAYAMWLCQCDCGGTKEVSASCLKNGHTQSCGCNRINDLTGKRFGKLVVKSFFDRAVQPNNSIRTEWLCECDCGETTVVSHGNLTSGHTTSCGCMVCSAQEAVIKRILVDNNINHAKEYTFNDLVSKGEKPRPFRFDFALFDNSNFLLALIEYQGSQHFVEYPGFEEYGAGQRCYSDQLKRDYCKTNNIPLYEITYLEDTTTRMYEILHNVYGNTVPSSQETA